MKTIQNTINESTHITKTPTHNKTHTNTHTHTHYKTHTYTHPHSTKPTHTHTHTHITKQITTPTVQDTQKIKQSQHNPVPSVQGHPNVHGTFIPK